MLVAFEGIDGSGKSTLARVVARRLRARGTPVTLTQEPTASWIGRAVRRGIRSSMDPLVLAGLFLADRAWHAVAIQPALYRGEVVLTDRYADSTTAYQGAALRDRVPGALEGLHVVQGVAFPRPDLVVWLDLPPKDALRRIRGRRVKEPFEKARFLERVRANYARLARAGGRRWLVLDGRRTLSSLADEVTRAIEDRLLRTTRRHSPEKPRSASRGRRRRGR